MLFLLPTESRQKIAQWIKLFNATGSCYDFVLNIFITITTLSSYYQHFKYTLDMLILWELVELIFSIGNVIDLFYGLVLPIVEINVVLKLFSLNLNKMHVFPTPESPAIEEKLNLLKLQSKIKLHKEKSSYQFKSWSAFYIAIVNNTFTHRLEVT